MAGSAASVLRSRDTRSQDCFGSFATDRRLYLPVDFSRKSGVGRDRRFSEFASYSATAAPGVASFLKAAANRARV